MSAASRRHLAPPRPGEGGGAGEGGAGEGGGVEKVEGFIKQLAADQVLVIVRGGLCLI